MEQWWEGPERAGLQIKRDEASLVDTSQERNPHLPAGASLRTEGKRKGHVNAVEL